MPSASPPPSQPPSPSPSPPPSPSRRWGGLREASAQRERAQSSAGSLSRGPAGEGEADGAAVTSRAVQSQLFERTGSSTALLLADRGPRRDRRRPGLVLDQLNLRELIASLKELIRLVAAVGVLLLEVAFVATLAYVVFFLVAVLPARAALASWRRIVAGLAGEDLT